MRQTSYELLPETWRRLDTEQVLERFLNVWEYEFGIVSEKIDGLLSINNPDKAQDRYLKLLAEIVGHEWDNSKTFIWNRNRIKYAIDRHSYKGTTARLTDDMIELGCESISVQDNASKLLVLSRQGRLSEPDAYMVTANFWHDGAYLLSLVDSAVPSLDRAAVEPAVYKTVPAGTIWYLQYGRQLFTIFEMAVSLLHGQAIFSGDQRQGILGFGKLIVDYEADRNEFLSWLPNRQTQKSYFPIVWHIDGTSTDGTIGYGILGDVFLSWNPTIPIGKSYFHITHHPSASLIGTIGDHIIGELPLSWQPEKGVQISQGRWKEIIFELGQAVATEDTYSQYLWLAEILPTRASTLYHQKDNYEEYESLGWATQLTGYREGLAVTQGYLTGDSNLPGNIDNILGNEGTPDIPLTEYQASLQAHSTKADEEDFLGASVFDSGDTSADASLVIFSGTTNFEYEDIIESDMSQWRWCELVFEAEPAIQTSQWRWHEVVFEAGTTIATEDTNSQYLWLAEAIPTKVFSQYRQKDNYDEFESLGWATQLTGYREGLAVAQGYLTGTSNLPGNIDDILGNEGTPDVPLTEDQAALQAASTKADEEDFLDGDEFDSGTTSVDTSLVINSGTTNFEYEDTIESGTVI
jgi:phage tail-like protein